MLAAIIFVSTTGCTWAQLRRSSTPACRTAHRRFERKADHFLGIAAIACTLICYRRLTR
ncbi:hypothetical protein CDO52_19955 [Nocardiopsis gilva YIM 90087]|uniref:Transposase n=1 Tax=Nocardiopsis gilva YIM 90087 TaxID=1235441 RepID=A0A223SDT9_9ACTN|nr:hypothetical protein CDO52_19955 [Nocardiopsis gilva YIM 90087]